MENDITKFSRLFDWIVFILEGKDGIPYSLNEFEILPDLTMDC